MAPAKKRSAHDAVEEMEPVAASNCKRQRGMMPAPVPRVMRLHIVRREVLTAADAAAAAAGATMDATVWRELPEAILWKVMLLVPAAKRFQFQVVSRKWRQELTSVHFVKAVMARERQLARDGGLRQVPCSAAVGCVPCSAAVGCVPRSEKSPIRKLVVLPAGEGAGAGDENMSRPRALTGSAAAAPVGVVHINLGFLPRELWGWYYCVVAAGDGLVCMSDTAWVGHNTRLCVVNPLTRTCRVLPRLPFPLLPKLVDVHVMVHLQAGVVAALCSVQYTGRGLGRIERVRWRWALATYDLETAATAGEGEGEGKWIFTPGPAPGPPSILPAPGPEAVLTHQPRRLHRSWPWLAGHFVTCTGRSYCYYDRTIYVHSVSRRPGPDGARGAGEMVEAWQVASPGRAWDPTDPAAAAATGPGQAATMMAYPRELVTMLVHRDTVYLVAMVEAPPQPRSRAVPEPQSFRIWELQQEDSAYRWRQVAALGRKALDWLTGFRFARCKVLVVRSACAAGSPQELQLGFEIGLVIPGGWRGREVGVMVSFSVPDKRWDLVHNHSELTGARAFQLSPNYYLM